MDHTLEHDDDLPAILQSLSRLNITDPPLLPNTLTEIIFSIVISTWQEWDVSTIIRPLSTTCHALYKYAFVHQFTTVKTFVTYLLLLHRLLHNTVERQGRCSIKNACNSQLYKCANISFNRHNFNALQGVLQRYTHPILSIHAHLDLLNQELIDHDMKAIQTTMANQPPFNLELEYTRAHESLTPTIITIPDNITSFNIKVGRGGASIITHTTSQLQHLTIRGPVYIANLKVPTLKSLIINGGYGFLKQENLSWLSQLTEITFSKTFNGNVDILEYATNLRKVCFSLTGIFDYQLDHLPPSVKHLELGGIVRKSLHNLPSSLGTLLLVLDTHDHNLDRLPQTLVHLELSVGQKYKHPLGSLPVSLQTLKITCFNASTLITNLPSHLLHLNINFRAVEKHFIQCLLPNTLQSLKLVGHTNSVAHLPPNLVTLDMGEMWRKQAQPTITNHIIRLINTELPSSIHSLILPGFFDSPFPSQQVTLIRLKRIEFGAQFNHTLENLPTSVEFIKFKACNSCIEFNQPLGNLPPALQELVFEGNTVFNQPITVRLPDSLRLIQFVTTNDLRY